jgi:hypothetical protein
MAFGLMGMQLADAGYNVTMILPVNQDTSKVLKSLNHKINVIEYPDSQFDMQAPHNVERWKLSFSYIFEPTQLMVEMMGELFYSDEWIENIQN